jgi:hypothetical protein
MDKQYNPDGFIPKHGGYERLITYQKPEIIYDDSYYFCKKYFQITKIFYEPASLKFGISNIPGIPILQSYSLLPMLLIRPFKKVLKAPIPKFLPM